MASVFVDTKSYFSFICFNWSMAVVTSFKIESHCALYSVNCAQYALCIYIMEIYYNAWDKFAFHDKMCSRIQKLYFIVEHYIRVFRHISKGKWFSLSFSSFQNSFIFNLRFLLNNDIVCGHSLVLIFLCFIYVSFYLWQPWEELTQIQNISITSNTQYLQAFYYYHWTFTCCVLSTCHVSSPKCFTTFSMAAISGPITSSDVDTPDETSPFVDGEPSSLVWEYT